MGIPSDFNPNGISRIKPLDDGATLVSYSDGKPSTVVNASSGEVIAFVDAAKTAKRADSDADHG